MIAGDCGWSYGWTRHRGTQRFGGSRHVLATRPWRMPVSPWVGSARQLFAPPTPATGPGGVSFDNSTVDGTYAALVNSADTPVFQTGAAGSMPAGRSMCTLVAQR